MKLNQRSAIYVGALIAAQLLLLVLVSAVLYGCGTQPTVAPTPTKTPTLPPVSTPTPATQAQAATPTPTPTPTTEASPAATATPVPTSTPTSVPLVEMGPDVNPLTGLVMADPSKLDRRPLAIKIPNYPAEARPQSGLSLADVVVEHEAEAYLTRFTAIFLGNDVLPELGPVRSVRLIDAELVPIFRSVLVTSGGHMAVKLRATDDKAWAEGYARIICPEEPFLGDGGTLGRIPKDGRRLELTLYTDTDSLWQLVADRGINQRQDFANMWTFSKLPPAGGKEVTHLQIVYKPETSVAEYKYAADTQSYQRFDVGQASVDALTGEQIAPANVLLIYANHVDTDIAADTHDPNQTWYSVSIQLWGTGPAKLLRDGQVYDATWVREDPQGTNDRFLIRDQNGNQIPFHPGPTWIQIVRYGADITID